MLLPRGCALLVVILALSAPRATTAHEGEHMEFDIAAPPAISITNAIAGDDLFNVTVDDCLCENPRCASSDGAQTPLLEGETRVYRAGHRAGSRCNYYRIGGSIRASNDGTVCYTFRADYKSCTLYPGEPFVSSFTSSAGAGACSRLNGATCTMRRSNVPAGQWFEYKTVTTLVASVDRDCNTLPWQPCSGPAGHGSRCCGAVDGWACRQTACRHILPRGDCARIEPREGGEGAEPGPETLMCQPPHGGPERGLDERVFVAWGARGTEAFNS